MSCKKCESIPEILTTVQEVKSGLREVKNEILGITNEAEANPTGVMETITLKQIVEKTAYDVECLRKRMDEQEESRRVKAQRKEQSSIEGRFVPKEIILKSKAEEINVTKKELEMIKKGRALVNGTSFQGKSSAELAASIAKSKLPITLGVVINNYLGETLTIKKTWTHRDYDIEIETPPAGIRSGQRDILKLSGIKNWIYGMIELAIGASDIRIILLVFNKAGRPVAGAGAFITTLKNIQLNMYLFEDLDRRYDNAWEYSGNIAFDPTYKGTEVFANPGNIRIRSVTELGRHAIATVDIGSVLGFESCSTRLACAPTSLETSVKPRLKSYGSALIVVSPIRQNRGCVIQIGNGLPVKLEEQRAFLDTQVVGIIPKEVSAHIIGNVCAHGERGFEGIVSYRVSGTDLRLYLGFRLGEDENEFAIGFFTLEPALNSSLLQFLLDDDPYLFRTDQKHGKASHGTLRIIRRNIVVEAKMTTSKKAIMEVLITTF